MKTTTTPTLLAAVILGGLCIQTAFSAAPDREEQPVKVFIVDDQSGIELTRDHGIRPIASEDIQVLVDHAAVGKVPVTILHQAVDEDASDNPVAMLKLKPFHGTPPMSAPSRTLAIRILAEKQREFYRDRARWQKEIKVFRDTTVAGVDNFLADVAVVQMEVAARHDALLAARNGRDFSRSDMVGSVMAAQRHFAESRVAILVLNSDCVDMPGKRDIRRTPLTEGELDPETILLFVNTSRDPERNILFKDLKNPVRHADTMAEAMEQIAVILSELEIKVVKQ